MSETTTFKFFVAVIALAPDEVRRWLEERPDPDSVMDRYVPEAGRTALSQNRGTE